jgi:tetratricopeptide (TPR) repeat protein
MWRWSFDLTVKRGVLIGVSWLGLACAGGRGIRPGAVTPAEIPALLTQAQQQPNNASVRFRLAAALMAAGRCDTAVVVVHAGELLAPADAVGPLVVGGCQEKGGRYDLAFATYTDFAARHPQARGVAAVRAKAQFALRTQAEQTARQALASESTLTRLAPEPSTLAVLPVTISATGGAGDSTFQPLSRGLAELMTSDLALVRTLRLLERVQVGALLDELKLGQSQRADPTTAARVGRLLRAERMVQGIASITANGPVRLSASVVRGDGTVRSGAQANGTFKELLDLEKQLVFGVAGQLGIQVTEAERQSILRQGPRNLVAFLAYSQGLDALDRGDYRAAAAAFNASVRADPSFQAAHEQQQAADAAPAAQGGGDVVALVNTVEQPPAPPEAPTLGALESAKNETSPSLGGVLLDNGTQSTQQELTPASQGITSVVQASGIIRIIFKRPAL